MSILMISNHTMQQNTMAIVIVTLVAMGKNYCKLSSIKLARQRKDYTVI